MAEVELNDIMSSFEANNCQPIPNKLLEYQMFNQPYYTGRILRLLLAPRQVPSPLDTRERLIEALKKRDKSHQSMFAKYERECKKLNNSTSNGKGSSSSKMLLMYSPLEEKLERLKRHYEDNEDQLGPIFSQVSTAINQVVSDIKKSIINNNDKSSKKHNGDICSPGLKEWEIQVSASVDDLTSGGEDRNSIHSFGSNHSGGGGGDGAKINFELSAAANTQSTVV
uniref:Fanconi anaemia group A protein helical domain-containing protein n=2 Tax=Amphimedon queenslandica TaxID=400682 RepID=A0A1X7TCM7_AMPQE